MIKVETYKHNKLSYLNSYPVNLYLDFGAGMTLESSGLTNRYGMVNFNIPVSGFPDVPYCSGEARLLYDNSYYVSNKDRFNFHK